MPSYGSVSCKYHPESPLIEDHRAGDQICSQCGLVVGDRVIDVSSEWRTFSDDTGGADKSRVGAAENSLLEGGNLSTMIGPGTGRPGETSYRNYTRPTSSNTAASDRSLINAMRIIAEMADRINLPKVITDRANKLFKMVQDGKHLTGRAHGAIAAACLYIACRQEGVPRTFKEIVAVTTVNKREIGRCFKVILRQHHVEANVELITTGDFMSRFCGNLQLSKHVQRAATLIAKKASDKEITPGRSPISITAAAIYMASQASEDKKTQREISEVAGVAEVTIRKSYKLMLERAKDLFPEDFKFHTPLSQLPKC